MGESLVLVLLLAVLLVPALLVARSTKRVGRSARRVERLELWAAPRGWRVLGADPEVLGRWQTPPFTATERIVEDAVTGEYRGRETTSFRLETTGPREVLHVVTVELRAALPVVQVMTGGVPAPELGDGAAWLRERSPQDLSLRVERGVVVGWLPGEPLLTELDRYLDVLVDVAERMERLAR